MGRELNNAVTEKLINVGGVITFGKPGAHKLLILHTTAKSPADLRTIADKVIDILRNNGCINKTEDVVFKF